MITKKFHNAFLLKKGRSFIIYLAILLSLPIILVVRALRPFVLIRFKGLISERIGHFTANPELYLCEKDLGMHKGKRVIDIFYYGKVCNQQVLKMYKRLLYIYRYSSILYKANRLIPGYEVHEVSLKNPLPDILQYRDVDDCLIKVKPHVWFTPDEEREGEKALMAMEIPKNAPFVCFHARDNRYLEVMFPNNDWYYHKCRDVTIYNYIPALDHLTNRGYFAIRMGAIVKEKLNTSNTKIIDYSNKYRTDFLDIFLISKCRFFIGCTTGLTNATYQLFRKPIVWVNFIPIGEIHSWGANSLVILKKLWLKKENHFMTFKEVFDLNIERETVLNKYEKLGIEIIENTQDEITAVTIEMDERLKGSWQTTEEDEELQKRFWALFKSSDWHGVIRSRIGRDFLRQNKDLLESKTK